ncbi:MAG: phosphatase PAP2 family protein [Nanoarchaeota archaeon]|nr:phosphatase PAP2 family protein [Nanoarchaeota archaeon]
MQPKYERVIKKVKDEITRDLTSFGSLPINALLLPLFAIVPRTLMLGILGLLAVDITSLIIKAIWFKDRPNKEPHENFYERILSSSFPSVHTARSTFTALFLFSTTTLWLGWIFILLPVAVGITRIQLKKHFWKDVFGGYILGFLIFYAIGMLL